MKLEITQNVFMKYWTMAERVTGTKSTMATLASILCEADENGVTLNATDLKTTIRIKAEGVNVLEPGTAILPLKVVGELFKKIAVSPFTVEVQDEKGTITAGRSHYSFTTYMVADFPELPSPRAAEEFTRVPAGELGRVLAEGSIAGAPNEDFPKYLSGGLLQISGGELRVVATDGRRLSLSKTLVQNSGEADELREMLLPLKSLDEYKSVLASVPPDQEVEVLQDGAVTYFNVPGVQYSVRCIDSKFPNYERILSNTSTTQLKAERASFLSALDRINVVVSDSSRMVLLTLSPGAAMGLTGRAPEVGEANESVDAEIDGEPLKVAFNVGYLIAGIKAFHGSEVSLSFNGSEGQMMISRPEGEDFIYMLMPIKLKSVETAMGGAAEA
ncbi:MAG: DNA polymerase III subunit beta [Pyramidobacter sp.]|nr:DNA polymerase III subunit beta [Pyramidobacter sp.]MBR0108278.1 DNA polymerase III subunit beta [Pyramidobacter sp.]MBR1896239.1 DNA polymerase III subunit beta [Pyramidobacter sp.]